MIGSASKDEASGTGDAHTPLTRNMANEITTRQAGVIDLGSGKNEASREGSRLTEKKKIDGKKKGLRRL